MNPYNHNANSYDRLYRLHKYWSKKPYNVVRDLILEHSKENEVVLDPFCGSGISVIESLNLRRKAIGIDINPSAIFITKQLISKVDLDETVSEFQRIETALRSQINSMYSINRNGEVKIGSHYVWVGNEMREVWYWSGQKLIKLPATRSDIDQSESYSYKTIENYYPAYTFLENTKINLKKGDNLFNLFSPRNLKALADIYYQIKLIENFEVRNLFKFCFTAILGQSSRMVFVNKRKIDHESGKMVFKTEKSVGSWIIGYWKPTEHFEINVWDCFSRKFKEILKVKKEQYKTTSVKNENKNFDELLRQNQGYLLLSESAQSFLKTLPENSIDYIVTDPPHGDRIPYLELSQLWNSWLNFEVNLKEEIIISSSKERGKNKEDYKYLLTSVFEQIFRVLKPNRKFTLMFNSLDDETWITIIQTLNNIGFYLERIETLNYSANSVVQENRESGLKKDFVLTYKKTNRPVKKITLLNGEAGEKTIIKMIRNINSENSIDKHEILNSLFFQLLKKHQFFRLSQALKLINNFNYHGN